MASVRMTIELRDRLINAYRKQCQSAYNTKFDVESTINEVVDSIQQQANTTNFAKLVETAEQFAELMAQHSNRYRSLYTKEYNRMYGSINAINQSGPDYGDGDNENVCPIKKPSQLYVVCNPSRPQSENLTTVSHWHCGFHDKWDGKYVEASDSFVEGDMLFVHDFGQDAPFLPFITNGNEDNYRAKEDYAPTCNLALVVTDVTMCDKLQAIPMAKQKVSDMVKKFEDFVEPITTLKKFLDEFPGGRSLVPEDKLQEMAAPAAKRKIESKVKAKDLLTPDLKQEFNEVMLESSLLGGNND